jgi:hypothetical protein
MAVYYQMGHQSLSLIQEPHLAQFKGAILSPFNGEREEIEKDISQLYGKPDFDLIFDPELYCPGNRSGYLPQWPYFPPALESGDRGSETWWYQLSQRLADLCLNLGINKVCSPIDVPKHYHDSFYDLSVFICGFLTNQLSGSHVQVIQTAVISLPDIAQGGRSEQIASILSRTDSKEIYLVLVGNTPSRRELNQSDDLLGVMKLISLLEGAGFRVIVSRTSSDIVLWKYAGASVCATGKHWTSRRYDPKRYTGGGKSKGMKPYWTEESLLAFLREPDVLRLSRQRLLGDLGDNPYSPVILSLISNPPPIGKQRPSWVRLGWCQYLYWFAQIENRIVNEGLDVQTLLLHAEEKWTRLITRKIRMDEDENNGLNWVRPWRKVVAEFSDWNI